MVKRDNLILFDEMATRKYIHRRFYGLLRKELNHPEMADSIVSPCMQLIKRDIAQTAKFEDIKKLGTFEDGLWQSNVYKNVKTFVYIDEPLYHYRKTNVGSITSVYKPDLSSTWLNLYGILENQIIKDGLSTEYNDALNNRIVLGILGLGINETFSRSNIFKKAHNFRKILKISTYRNALSKFKVNYLPFKWKIFFLMCKYNFSFLCIFTLQILIKSRN